MEAKKDLFKNFITQQISISIPIYQREYSWKTEECRELWEDIIEVGNDNRKNYFIGSVVFRINESALLETNQNINIIDGQQRITTLTLLICSLCNLKTIKEEDKKTLFNNYIINNNNKKTRKLNLRREDDKTLEKIVDSIKANKNPKFNKKDSLNIVKAYQFFSTELTKIDYKIVEKGLNKLSFVSVGLEKKDKPQLIFESLNSTGKALSNSDLVRNYILMGSDNQNELYEEYWKPIEEGFINRDEKDFDDFIFNYLMIKQNKVITRTKTYKEFKTYKTKYYENDVESLVKDIYKYSEYYFRIAYAKEEDSKLRLAFESLNTLNVSVTYRFLLKVYDDYEESKNGNPIINLSKQDFISIVKIVESYIIRRFICTIPTQSQTHTFMKLNTEIDKKNYLNSFIENLTQYDKNDPKHFPTNEEVKNALRTKSLKTNVSKHILSTIENHDNKEEVNIKSITLEHIMPKRLNREWQKALGENFKETHEIYLNTIGNLTLTFYNSEMSNKPFTEKQIVKGGFKDSKLKLNQYLTNIDKWNKEEIIKRTDNLSREIIEIWEYPGIINESISKKEEEIDLVNYFNTNTEKLYERLNKSIKKTDENIKKEIKEECIIYKINNQNIMEIISKENELELYFDLSIEELDADDKCENIKLENEDITGTIKVDFDKINKIYYIMYLFKKAYDKKVANSLI